MAQTIVLFNEPYGRINELVGNKTVRIVNTGCRKRSFTAAFAGSALRQKFLAFMILKDSKQGISNSNETLNTETYLN